MSRGNKLEKRYIKAFEATKDFVSDLDNCFGKSINSKSFVMYKRLLDKTPVRKDENYSKDEIEKINKVLSGMRKFVGIYEEKIKEGDIGTIPRGVLINYGDSDKIAIEIQKFFFKADKEVKEIICEHLITIDTILDPEDKKIDELEKQMQSLGVNKNTPEGRHVAKMMENTQKTMEEMGDVDNPMQALMGMMGSGGFQEMIGDMQKGAEDGSLDMKNVLGTMHGMIGNLMNDDDE